MQTVPALRPMGQAAEDWLERLRCWVLALPQPATPHLQGQACDRLRPRFVAVALEQELQQRLGVTAVSLVHWQWHSRTGQVSGLLLQAGQLQRFWWHAELDQFRTEDLLQLRLQRLLQVCSSAASGS